MARVERCEIVMAHVNLAAHLQDCGGVAKRLRDIGNGAGIGGDVLTCLTIAACCRADQLPILVAQRGRQTVNLGLGGKGQWRVWGEPQISADASHEIGHIGGVKGIGQRQHPLGMGDLGEAFAKF